VSHHQLRLQHVSDACSRADNLRRGWRPTDTGKHGTSGSARPSSGICVSRVHRPSHPASSPRKRSMTGAAVVPHVS
jgi:hypothetical protein